MNNANRFNLALRVLVRASYGTMEEYLNARTALTERRKSERLNITECIAEQYPTPLHPVRVLFVRRGYGSERYTTRVITVVKATVKTGTLWQIDAFNTSGRTMVEKRWYPICILSEEQAEEHKRGLKSADLRIAAISKKINTLKTERQDLQDEATRLAVAMVMHGTEGDAMLRQVGAITDPPVAEQVQA